MHFKAGGTINVARAVMVDTAADFRVVEATAGAVCLGIAQMAGRSAPIPEVTTDPPIAANEGELLDVIIEGIAYCSAGAAIANGAWLKATTDGQLIAVTNSGLENVIALALETAAAQHEIIKVLIVHNSLTTP